MEMIHNHTNVILQPEFDDPRFSGLNPYALGFGMMQDIKRICENPTDEDREWFPNFAGSDDWRGVLKDAWENYRDESFILQFLSPELIRKLKLFVITDDDREEELLVSHIHNEPGYRKIRRILAKSYNIAFLEPDIQVVDTDLKGDRLLKLRHILHDNILLNEKDRDLVLAHLKTLWGYDVSLEGIDRDTGDTVYTASTVTDV